MSNNSTETNSVLEASFKDLLDKILNYFERFIKTPEELTSLEKKLNDYHSLAELIDITKNVFNSLTETIDEKLIAANAENYDELEKIVQKHEGEIRNHIRMEQQLKLYSESIQEKLDESEKAKTNLTEETKAMIDNLKKENEKLAASLKQKTTQNESLNSLLKELEDANKEYKKKLEELPALQERINSLEKQTKVTSNKPFVVLKDASPFNHDNENFKRIDVDMEYCKANIKPESARRSVKGVNTNPYISPLKFINKSISGVSNKNKDHVKVKVEVNDKQRQDLDALKHSYQKFYNPSKSQPKEQRTRHATSVNKTRELKSIYSIPLVTHSSNTSLVQVTQNFSHRDHTLTKLHQRSSSYGGRTKSRASIVKIDDNL